MTVSREAFAPAPLLRRRYSRLPAFALAILVAVGLKAHYSAAPVDRLSWIMRPTAGFVELCAGLPFEREEGAGYINHEHRVVIAKACAGVNFLIMSFCMLAFTLIGSAGAGRRPFLTVAAALAAAYAATVIVNGVRIMLALQHGGDAVGQGWLTPERVHRLEGIVVYFAALAGLSCLARLIVRAGNAASFAASLPERRLESRSARCSLILVPLGWYAAMTLGVPLLNGAMRSDPAQFGEHVLWVLSVPLVLAGLLLLADRLFFGDRKRAGGSAVRCASSSGASAPRGLPPRAGWSPRSRPGAASRPP